MTKTKRKSKNTKNTDQYDILHKPHWYAINGRLKVSASAIDLYDEDMTRTPQKIQLLLKRIIKDTGGVEIKYNAVQMAIARHRKNLIKPRLKAAIDKMNEVSEDAAEDGIVISGIFKDVIKYKKFAEDQGVKMSIGEITTLLDKSNQLKKNEYEYVTKDKMVEATCDLILQFRMACDADPDIDDPMHSFLEDDRE